ncbi:MAG: type III pantothenate kinase [Rhodothermales bacterium]|jgi:type III pantothenate kinase
MRHLVIDVGNTLTKVGDPGPGNSWKVERMLSDDLVGYLQGRLAGESPESARVRVGLCSVVPSAAKAVLDVLAGRAPFVVSHTVRLPFEMAYETPETLGNDRIAAASAAVLTYAVPNQPVLVVDAGTAVTYEVVDAGRVYRGGAIAPGPTLLHRALHAGTAQLPRTSGPPPNGPVGRSTVDAIRSGIHFGFVDAVAGMIRRLKQEAGEGCLVVATGGWAPKLAALIPDIEIVDPNLVLTGVLRLMELDES